MSMVNEEQVIEVAEQCAKIVHGVNPDRDGSIETALYAGEPDLAIVDALYVASNHEEVTSQLPVAALLEIAHDPTYSEVGRFTDMLKGISQ